VSIAIRVFPDTYIDSVVQLRGMRAMREIGDVEWASAGMATPANIETLRAEGVDPADVEGIGSNDFFIVARGIDEEAASEALTVGEAAVLYAYPPAEGEQQAEVHSLREALRVQPESNVAVVSVPGDYAALAAYQALSSNLHVLLFSDHVPLDKEIALKDYALSRGRLVMGPGAGTAMLGATGLGFANAVRPGRVGLVAAAGTGAQ
jgi:FdrA protein